MPENLEKPKEEAGILATLTQEQRRRLLEEILEKVDRKLPDLLHPTLEELLEKHGLSLESIGLLQLLAARSNNSRAETLEKALTLYGLAIDAIEKGNHVAILDSDDVIVREIVVFEPLEAGHR